LLHNLSSQAGEGDGAIQDVVKVDHSGHFVDCRVAHNAPRNDGFLQKTIYATMPIVYMLRLSKTLLSFGKKYTKMLFLTTRMAS